MAKRDEKWLSEIGRFFFPFMGKDCGVWWRLWKQKDKNLCKARTWHARAKNAFSKVKAPSISENSKRIRAKVKYRPTLLIGFAANSGSSTTSKKHLGCIYEDHGLRFVGLDFWFQRQHQAPTAELQLTQHNWRIPTFWKPHFAEVTAYQKIIADFRDFFSLWGFCLPYIIGGWQRTVIVFPLKLEIWEEGVKSGKTLGRLMRFKSLFCFPYPIFFVLTKLPYPCTLWNNHISLARKIKKWHETRKSRATFGPSSKLD